VAFQFGNFVIVVLGTYSFGTSASGANIKDSLLLKKKQLLYAF
jgi:hypothetical protein